MRCTGYAGLRGTGCTPRVVAGVCPRGLPLAPAVSAAQCPMMMSAMEEYCASVISENYVTNKIAGSKQVVATNFRETRRAGNHNKSPTEMKF